MKITTKLAAWLLAASLLLSCTAPAMAQELSDVGESTPVVQENLEETTGSTVTEEMGDGTEAAPTTPVNSEKNTGDAGTEESANDTVSPAEIESPLELETATDIPTADGMVHWKDLKALAPDLNLPLDGEDDAVVTQLEAMAFLMLGAGLADTQLGSYPDDYRSMAQSMGLLSAGEQGDDPCTQEQFDSLKNSYEITALKQAVEKQTPLFLNGMAQPIFPYTTGVDHDYSNATSDIIRYCVYVETNHDTDGDGKLDLVKALVQLPKAAAEGKYKAATIYEARPYITGCTDYSLPYVEGELGFDMYASPAARVAAGTTDTMTHAANAKFDDWYYYNPFEQAMCYEDLEWYDSYLVRGFAVVEVGGLGTRGSEGFETCGSDLEIDAFKCVIEWLTGDRVAYTDKTSNIAITADWSNGKVGMTGRSYAGTTQFGLAATGVKGLETIVPVAGIASWYDYTNSQGVHTRWSPAYTNSLAAYCTGRYLDSTEAQAEAHELEHPEYTSNGDFETIREKYGHHLYQMKQEQLALNGDYGDHWANRDYTTSNNFQCPALIVHGLNDYNVRPKHFDMMYRSFRDAGQNVKLLLHQDGHLTPTYPSASLTFDIGDETYDEILNRWFSHYLYGLDNNAENMAAVTVEDSHSPTWHTYDSWETAVSLTLSGSGEENAAITSSIPNVNSGNWAEVFSNRDTEGNVRYTMELAEDIVIKGVSQVSFTASVNNAAALPEGTPLNRDNLMVSAMLVDLAPEGETFPVFHTEGSYVPKTILKKGGAWMGGGLKNLDLTQHQTVNVSYNVITRGWMDLCNPNAGYNSASAAQSDRVELKAGEYHNYTIYLQPTVYEVPAGHTLGLVLYAHEPGMGSDYDQQYTITLEQNSVKAEVPVEAGSALLSVSAGRGGCVTASAANGPVPMNSKVQVTASADPGYTFSGWTVNGTAAGSTNPLTVTMDQNMTIVANFTKNQSHSGSSGGSAPIYTVTVENADHGTVTLSPKRPEKGQIVHGTVQPEPGYILKEVTVTAKDGSMVETKVSDSGFQFQMPGTAITVHAVFTPAANFSDVAEGAYYHDAVLWAVSKGITNGLTSTVFAPQQPCTRAQAITFLWRSMGSPAPVSGDNHFADVTGTAYYKDAVLWAVENGLTQGTSADTFNPNQTVSRAQFLTFLARLGGSSTAKQHTIFTDVPDNVYYHDAVEWAVDQGITNGTSATTFSPNAPCTRGQIVTFLWRSAQ